MCARAFYKGRGGNPMKKNTVYYISSVAAFLLAFVLGNSFIFRSCDNYKSPDETDVVLEEMDAKMRAQERAKKAAERKREKLEEEVDKYCDDLEAYQASGFIVRLELKVWRIYVDHNTWYRTDINFKSDFMAAIDTCFFPFIKAYNISIHDGITGIKLAKTNHNATDYF